MTTPQNPIAIGAALFVVGMLVAIARKFYGFLGWFIQPARGGK